ncbi:BRCA1 C Terminus (BRCT) domain [Geosmithia morbida]|uniref:BRCA1 C Terminus (BRCT) domain n=1 Tax=Geosmithia morbida TaxID=1094350 RepID=A0A9P4YS08_9HYPO|nr:BRCA1 C Terminus (BRCT) domain [Geosmithia morbida]KAF4120772.1 BRCA1 C Terminus (BRCT) domain [Geosmithia morbida]
MTSQQGDPGDTQDSQLLWAAMREELGVAEVQQQQQQQQQQQRTPQAGLEDGRIKKRDDAVETVRRDAVIAGHTPDSNRMTIDDEQQPQQQEQQEPTQETPTQPNEDREYEDDSLPPTFRPPTQPDIDDGAVTQLIPDDGHTLQENDMGAVHFGELSEAVRPSSQVSEDGGFEKTRGDWRQHEQTSQLQGMLSAPKNIHSHSIHTPFKTPAAPGLPETPTLSRNPFGGTMAGAPAPFAGSQLFGQTQFSSAVKPPGVTPTSSRPSPTMLPLNTASLNVAETSPLKGRTNVSSPTDVPSPSPARLDEVPATVTRLRKPMERIAEETPLHARFAMAADDTVTILGSSGSPRQPLAFCETVKKPQERRAPSPPQQPQQGKASISIWDFDDDEDDAFRRLERRKRVERKKAQAAQEMEKVSFTPRAEPARKRRRVVQDGDEEEVKHNLQPQPQSQVPKASGKNGYKSSNTEPVVRDSQQRWPSNQTPILVRGSTQGTKEDTAPAEEDEGIGEEGPDVVAIDTPGPNHQPVEDRIPATSPAASPSPDEDMSDPPPPEPELPSLSTNADGRNTSSPQASQRPIKRQERKPRRRTVITSSASEMPQPSPQVISAREEEEETKTTTGEDDDGVDADDQVEQPEPMPEPVARRNAQRRSCGKPKQTAIITSSAHPSPSPAAMAQGEEERGEEEMETTHDDVYSVKADSEPPGQSEPTAKPVPRRKTGPRNLSPAKSLALPEQDTPSMSSLSSAPPSSAMTTPDLRDYSASERAASAHTQPSTGRGRRGRGKPAASAEPVAPQRTARWARAAKMRAPRYASESTDETRASPPVSLPATNKGGTGRISRTSVGPGAGTTQRGRRLFEGMAFAISFQSNSQSRGKLETRITQAGGTILTDGFDELFETARSAATMPSLSKDVDEPMVLSRAYRDTGFTALVADSHSRKAKYMQALALGLPCLAPQWITTCLARGELVDWEPYLLCAGASSVLGNALRSRTLTPYAAADARLADVIDCRRQMLRGQRILAVVADHSSSSSSSSSKKKGKSGGGGGGGGSSSSSSNIANNVQPYMFLAQAMGPSISTVMTAEQARDALSRSVRDGRPFDWVYVDKGAVAGGAAALWEQQQQRTGAKKRKRTSAASASTVLDRGATRVLDDELVIQSLILGRMVEEDEMP